MVLLFVVCGWREEAVRGGSVPTYVLGTFYIRFILYQGYDICFYCEPPFLLFAKGFLAVVRTRKKLAIIGRIRTIYRD